MSDTDFAEPEGNGQTRMFALSDVAPLPEKKRRGAIPLAEHLEMLAERHRMRLEKAQAREQHLLAELAKAQDACRTAEAELSRIEAARGR
jgi:hypothetical protein